MSKFTGILIAAAVLVAHGTGAEAADLIYTLNGGTITGSLNGVEFTDAPVVITAMGDPANVVNSDDPVPNNRIVLSTTFIIEGFSSVVVTEANYGAVSFNLGQFSGISFVTMDDLVGIGIYGLGTQNFISLTTPASVSSTMFNSTSLLLETTGGDLIINSVGGTGTFTVTAVPEPGTIALSALGAFTLAFIAKSRRRNALVTS